MACIVWQLEGQVLTSSVRFNGLQGKSSVRSSRGAEPIWTLIQRFSSDMIPGGTPVL